MFTSLFVLAGYLDAPPSFNHISVEANGFDHHGIKLPIDEEDELMAFDAADREYEEDMRRMQEERFLADVTERFSLDHDRAHFAHVRRQVRRAPARPHKSVDGWKDSLRQLHGVLICEDHIDKGRKCVTGKDEDGNEVVVAFLETEEQHARRIRGKLARRPRVCIPRQWMVGILQANAVHAGERRDSYMRGMFNKQRKVEDYLDWEARLDKEGMCEITIAIVQDLHMCSRQRAIEMIEDVHDEERWVDSVNAEWNAMPESKDPCLQCEYFECERCEQEPSSWADRMRVSAYRDEEKRMGDSVGHYDHFEEEYVHDRRGGCAVAEGFYRSCELWDRSSWGELAVRAAWLEYRERQRQLDQEAARLERNTARVMIGVMGNMTLDYARALGATDISNDDYWHGEDLEDIEVVRRG
jgi:hypothetical protein